jgi:hypothetical protein
VPRAQYTRLCVQTQFHKKEKKKERKGENKKRKGRKEEKPTMLSSLDLLYSIN